MAQKGLTKSGEAYCLHCKSYVDPSIERCPSCGSGFGEEVKAFFCPRCESLLTLGTSACPECGMKFRVKAIRHDGSVVDLDRYSPEEAKPAMAAVREAESDVSRLSDEQLQQLRGLVASLTALAEGRSAFAARLNKTVQEEQDRLESLSRIDAGDPRLDDVEAQVATISDEMARLMNLYSEMASVVDDVSSISESLGLSDETRKKGLAAMALRVRNESAAAGGEDLKVREEQLAKREEMVDRKIKGYAQKKKELDDREAELTARTERLERERALLGEMKARAEPDLVESIRENEIAEYEREVARRLARMESSLRREGEAQELTEDAAVEDRFSSLESLARRMLEENEESGLRIRELTEGEDEVRRLLKSLDQLLGKLPEPVVLQFTQSEDYRLYEKVLDRLKI